ncbi:MAG: OmpA family protein [Bacteroidetes bacterium]|nr:OmpA family protein [Bacteroidota bacterium]
MKEKTNNRLILKIVGVFLSTTTLAFSQNLVDNGDFESTSGKVKKLGELSSADSWSSPTASKPDLFIAGKTPEIGVPQNIYGSEEAKSGGAYAGIVAFSYGDKVPRTYLMTRLNTSMKKGTKYCVQYSISLAEGSKYSCNNMGAVFSKKEYGLDAKSSLIDKPSIVSEKSYSATFGWDKVCGIYIADGNEKYMIVGNFASNEDVKSEKNKTVKGAAAEQIIAAYYYIDDVSVIEMNDETICDCATADPSEEYSTMIYQKQIVLNQKMTPIEKIEAQEVYFAFGTNRLTPLGQDILKDLAELLTANPSLKVEIQGHNDQMEDEVGLKRPAYADMGTKRISAVMEYLLAVGINENRIIPSPKGSQVANPEIRDYDDEEMAQAKNRRVTFKVR